jgi:hypothetical protein
MKIVFDAAELTWLHEFVNQTLMVARGREDFAPLARTAAKMRYKFHGIPSYVNLTGKERALLSEMIDYRLGSLRGDLMSVEAPLLKQIRERL